MISNKKKKLILKDLFLSINKLQKLLLNNKLSDVSKILTQELYLTILVTLKLKHVSEKL
jgi:hypothetical protein